MYTDDERQQQAERLKEREAVNRQKFMRAKPKAIKLPLQTG
jgi:hypothetical protein